MAYGTISKSVSSGNPNGYSGIGGKGAAITASANIAHALPGTGPTASIWTERPLCVDDTVSYSAALDTVCPELMVEVIKLKGGTEVSTLSDPPPASPSIISLEFEVEIVTEAGVEQNKH